MAATKSLAGSNDANLSVVTDNGDGTGFVNIGLTDEDGNIATKDAGPAWTSVHGVGNEPVISADASGGMVVSDTPGTGLNMVLTDVIISVGAAMSVIIACDGVPIIGPIYMAANSTIQLTPRDKSWKTVAAPETPFSATASVAGNIMVDAHYYYEA